MDTNSAQPHVDAIRNIFTTEVAAPGIHQYGVILAADREDIAIGAEAHYHDKDVLYFSTRLRELGVILFRELFGVRNVLRDLVTGEFPRGHFLDWFQTAFPPAERVFWVPPSGPAAMRQNIPPGQSQTPQPAGNMPQLTARDLISVLRVLHNVMITSNGDVHELLVGDVIRVMQDPGLKSKLGDGPFTYLAKMVNSILGSSYTIYNPDTMDTRLKKKSFNDEVVSFRTKIVEAQIFKRINTEWAALYRADKWQGVTQKLEEEGRLLSGEDKNKLAALDHKLDKLAAHEEKFAAMPAMEEEVAKVPDIERDLRVMKQKLDKLAAYEEKLAAHEEKLAAHEEKLAAMSAMEKDVREMKVMQQQFAEDIKQAVAAELSEQMSDIRKSSSLVPVGLTFLSDHLVTSR